VIVIGAGPGGLAAALLLAQAGVQVHVVERLRESVVAAPRLKPMASASISARHSSSIPRFSNASSG